MMDSNNDEKSRANRGNAGTGDDSSTYDSGSERGSKSSRKRASPYEDVEDGKASERDAEGTGTSANDDVETIRERNEALARANQELMEEKRRRLEAKRAYDRVNAARARQRIKDQLSELNIKLDEFREKNEKLEKNNDELVKKVSQLTDENQLLRSILLNNNVSGVPGVGTFGGVSGPTGYPAAAGTMGYGPPGVGISGAAVGGTHPTGLGGVLPNQNPAAAFHGLNLSGGPGQHYNNPMSHPHHSMAGAPGHNLSQIQNPQQQHEYGIQQHLSAPRQQQQQQQQDHRGHQAAGVGVGRKGSMGGISGHGAFGDSGGGGGPAGDGFRRFR